MKLLHVMFYSARNARIASAVLATAIPSVRPSVCLSVTRRYCVNTGTWISDYRSPSWCVALHSTILIGFAMAEFYGKFFK